MANPAHPFAAQPVRVIHLRGSEREQGRQHAEQVGAACQVGMPSFYHRLHTRLLSQQPTPWHRKALWSAAKTIVDPFLVDRLLRAVPQAYKDRLAGMAEVAQLSERQLLTALVLPDLFPLVQGGVGYILPNRFVEVAQPLRLGCSSFVSRGESFLVGRNLDFPGVGYWDRYPVLQARSPTNRLRSVSFTTAGVPIGGITGINEAQISVSIHQHYCQTVSLRGQLPFLIGETILNEASNLDEALAILKKSRLTSSWAFLVADGKRRDAFLWESTPRAQGIVRLSDRQGVLAHSNFFQTPACQAREFAATARMNWDNYWRKTRLETLVRDSDGKLTPSLAAKALSDHWDPHWEEEKILNRIVSQSFNIQSLVLEPEKMQVWFAHGNSPIHLGNFQKYDLQAILEGGSGEQPGIVPGYRFEDSRKAEAKTAFITAFIYAMDGDEPTALVHLKKSLATSFCPEVAQIAGVLCLKNEEWERAAQYFDSAVEWIEKRLQSAPGLRTPPEYYECRLFQGRTKDLQGKHGEAASHYNALIGGKDIEDRNLLRIAKRRKPFCRQDLQKLILPFSSYVPFG